MYCRNLSWGKIYLYNRNRPKQNKRASPNEVDMVSVSNFGVQVLKVYNNNSEMRGKIMES